MAAPSPTARRSVVSSNIVGIRSCAAATSMMSSAMRRYSRTTRSTRKPMASTLDTVARRRRLRTLERHARGEHVHEIVEEVGQRVDELDALEAERARFLARALGEALDQAIVLLCDEIREGHQSKPSVRQRRDKQLCNLCLPRAWCRLEALHGCEQDEWDEATGTAGSAARAVIVAEGSAG